MDTDEDQLHSPIFHPTSKGTVSCCISEGLSSRQSPERLKLVLKREGCQTDLSPSSVLICVHLWISLFQPLKHGGPATPGCGAGMEGPTASMTAQPGGMSADILPAHNIAAAKVRRQSLQIRALQIRLLLRFRDRRIHIGGRGGRRTHIQHEQTLSGGGGHELVARFA